jgi:hypothetical protein
MLIICLYIWVNKKTINMKMPKNRDYVDYDALNPIQKQYINDCILLENLGVPNDLLDNLYRATYLTDEIKKIKEQLFK